LGGGGWLHDFYANGIGPDLDTLVGNSGTMLTAMNDITGTLKSGFQSLTVTINAQGITTKEAAQQLSDSIAKTLATQMAGSSLRSG
jgi:hypothetical protein